MTRIALTPEIVKAVVKRDDVRGLWPDELNAEMACLFGQAFCAYLRHTDSSCEHPRIAVGRDARLGSPDLALAFARGVREAGGSVVDLGLASTEHVYFMTGTRADELAGGAMITASHNPPEYNGIKFAFRGARPLGKHDLHWMRDRVIDHLPEADHLDIGDAFARFAIEETGLDALPDRGSAAYKVVVGAGNGVGGQAFMPIASRLERKGFRFEFLDGEPDGRFPHGVPNPLSPHFLGRIRHAVRQREADFGIGFDGDGDRAGFIDRTGTDITASQVLALVAEQLLKDAPDNPVIMRNLCCSRLLVDVFGPRDTVTLVNTPVGHGKIKLLMRHQAFQSRVVFAGEHSGHYFYKEFFYVDSGTLTALHMLRFVAQGTADGRSLEDQLRPWRQRYAWSGELNYTFDRDGDRLQALSELADHYQQQGGTRYEVREDPKLKLDRVFVAKTPYDPGPDDYLDLKFEFVDYGAASGWWFVARPSGNEPKLRLNVESWGGDAGAKTRKHVADIETVISDHGGRPSPHVS